MDKVSTPTNANYSSIDGTTSFEPSRCSAPVASTAAPQSTGGDATGGDGFDPTPAPHDARAEHALQIGLTVGSKVSSGAGAVLRGAGYLAGPSQYASAAEALQLSRASGALTTAANFARGGGALLSAVAGGVQVYEGYSRHNTKDEVFGALKIGAAVVTAVNPPLGLAAGVGIFVAEQVADHLSAGKSE